MSEILLLISITLLAAISPGPDMIVVLKNAMRSKKLGYMTAIWVGLAILVHVGYCIAWIGIIISQSIILFSIIKILWAIYLLYIAYQLLRSWKSQEQSIKKWKEMSFFEAFREGFLTNVMNPKATLFFLSVFTQVIEPHTPMMTQAFYGILMAMVVGMWFVILTSIMNIPIVQSHIHGIQYYMNKIMWWLLAFIGIKILVSSHK